MAQSRNVETMRTDLYKASLRIHNILTEFSEAYGQVPKIEVTTVRDKGSTRTGVCRVKCSVEVADEFTT